MTNIVFITLDDLRPDRLGCYGNKDNLTPHIDEVAKEAYVFNNAYTVITSTKASHTSMFTSLYPQNHKVLKNTVNPSKKLTNFVELLAKKGFQTIGFPSVQIMSSYYGMKRGFTKYVNNSKLDFPYYIFSHINIFKYNLILLFHRIGLCKSSSKSSTKTNKDVFKVLKKGIKKPFFMWVHYFDLHQFTVDNVNGVKPEKRGYQDLYNENVKFIDNSVGELFKKLKEDGLYDDSIIVLMADHGEALIDVDGYRGHGTAVDECQIKIPLVIRFPKKGHKKVDAFATNIDLMPMIFEELGIEYDKADGKNVLKEEHSEVYSLAYPPYKDQKTVFNKDHKLVITNKDKVELFDRKTWKKIEDESIMKKMRALFDKHFNSNN